MIIEKLIDEYKSYNILNQCRNLNILWKIIVIVIYIITSIGLLHVLYLSNLNILLYIFTLALYFIVLCSLTLLSFKLISNIIVKRIEKYLKVNDEYFYNELIKHNNYKISKILLYNREKQIKWLILWCEENNINSFDKFDILKNEIGDRINREKFKYFDLVVFGTLMLSLWNMFCNQLENIRGIPVITILITLVIVAMGISFFIPNFKKHLQDLQSILNIFNESKDLKNLYNLLIQVQIQTCK